MKHYLLTIKEYGSSEPYSLILASDNQEDIDYLVDMHVTHDEYDNVEAYSINEITERQSFLLQEQNIELDGDRRFTKLVKNCICSN